MLHFDHREHGHPGTMPTLELGPDVFPGTQTTMLFFTGLQKSSLCVRVLTKLVPESLIETKFLEGCFVIYLFTDTSPNLMHNR